MKLWINDDGVVAITGSYSYHTAPLHSRGFVNVGDFGGSVADVIIRERKRVYPLFTPVDKRKFEAQVPITTERGIAELEMIVRKLSNN